MPIGPSGWQEPCRVAESAAVYRGNRESAPEGLEENGGETGGSGEIRTLIRTIPAPKNRTNSHCQVQSSCTVVQRMAEGQGFEPWRALRPCRFSVPTIAFATERWLVCGLDFAFAMAPGALGGSRQVSTRSSRYEASLGVTSDFQGVSPNLTPYICRVSTTALDLTRPVHSTALPTFQMGGNINTTSGRWTANTTPVTYLDHS